MIAHLYAMSISIRHSFILRLLSMFILLLIASLLPAMVYGIDLSAQFA
jgi:hypothetical protein